MCNISKVLGTPKNMKHFNLSTLVDASKFLKSLSKSRSSGNLSAIIYIHHSLAHMLERARFNNFKDVLFENIQNKSQILESKILHHLHRVHDPLTILHK